MKTESVDRSDPDFQQFNGFCLELRKAIEGIGAFQRRYIPSQASQPARELLPLKSSLAQAKLGLQEMVAPDPLLEPLDIVIASTKTVLDALETIIAASTTDSQDTMAHMMRASRGISRVQENLYPLRLVASELDGLFLEATTPYGGETSSANLPEGVLVGLNHIGIDDDNDYGRGAFSFYVPESYTGETPLPMVVALHGGSGHGRDYIWTWLREARSRGFILLSPTAMGRTWSILEPEIDGERLFSILDFLERRYNFDMNRILVTGMSDGGTFALMCCLQERSPFTAFAPVAGVLPSLDVTHAKGRRIYWVHGVWDWMFPLQRAQDGSEVLEKAGADITFRPIDDLSHTYPREENDRILKWFDPDMPLPV